MILVAGGDVAAGRPLSDPKHVAELLQESDVTFANLESPLTDEGCPAEKAITLRSPPSMGRTLAELGFDLLGLANNHVCDYGVQGLSETMQALEDVDVRTGGAGSNLEEALQPKILDRAGSRVAFLSFSCTLPPGFAATAAKPGVAPIRIVTGYEIDPVTIAEQPGTAPFARTSALDHDVREATGAIAAARGRSDIVVVGIHWGVPPGWMPEFQGILAEYQRPLGHALIDAGAELVVGHHPHCLQGVEAYSHGWIAFSTGNFWFQPLTSIADVQLGNSHPPYQMNRVEGPWTHKSVLMRVQFDGETASTIELIPLALDDNGEPRRVRGRDAAAVLDPMARHCRELGTMVGSEGGRFFVKPDNSNRSEVG